MKILFITRCYPPVIGGMEKVSLELTTHISRLTDTYLIANRKGKKWLPLFLPYALFKAFYLVKTRSIDIVHLSDGMLAPLGVILKRVLGIPVVSTVHGLDVTYPSDLYQRIVPACLKELDKLVCISRHTRSECLNRQIPSSSCQVIPNGINPDEFYLEKSGARKKFQQETKIKLNGKRCLLSVGHLVTRKGFQWFIREVMTRLDKNTVYVIIGGYGNASRGNELEVYAETVKKLKLDDRVFLLGKVSFDTLRLAYNSADLLVMPNIEVKGDMEGFGMVALEAASCGLPVLASDLEGIKDAITEGENGFLIEPGNTDKYLQKIKSYENDDRFRKRVREYTLRKFNWGKIAHRYRELLSNVSKPE